MSESDNGSYWQSLEGILTRIADIAHNFSWGSLAETIKGLFVSEPEAKKLYLHTVDDYRTCDLCEENAGEYSEDDEMLPDVPIHVNCRCYWDLVAEYPEEPKIPLYTTRSVKPNLVSEKVAES